MDGAADFGVGTDEAWLVPLRQFMLPEAYSLQNLKPGDFSRLSSVTLVKIQYRIFALQQICSDTLTEGFVRYSWVCDARICV